MQTLHKSRPTSYIFSLHTMRGGGCPLEEMNSPVKKIIHVIVNKEGREKEERENEKAKAFRLMT